MIVEYWENGKLKQRPATHEEEISHTDWHNMAKPIRVILSIDCLRMLNIKKEFNATIEAIYGYFKSTELEKYEINDGLFIYLSEINSGHAAILTENGAKIETLTI